MSKDPYAILHAVVRAESVRHVSKPRPDARQDTSEPTPKKQAPPKGHERG